MIHARRYGTWKQFLILSRNSKTMIQRALFSTLLAAMILPVSGCGGSGDSAPQPKGPTAIRTKPAEVAKAAKGIKLTRPLLDHYQIPPP